MIQHHDPPPGSMLMVRQVDDTAWKPHRRCWELCWPTGRSTHVGLFVSQEAAREWARTHGWAVVGQRKEAAA